MTTNKPGKLPMLKFRRELQNELIKHHERMIRYYNKERKDLLTLRENTIKEIKELEDE